MSNLDFVAYENAAAKKRTSFIYDASTDEYIQVMEQDVTSILELNKKARSGDGFNGDKIWCRHVAWIPDIVVMEWIKDGTMENPEEENNDRLFKRLDDSDYKNLKTTDKKIY